MGTKLLKNRGSRVDIDTLPQNQQAFVLAVLSQTVWNMTEAARQAGAKNPKLQANRWIHDRRVAAVLGREMRMRNERARMTNDEVLAQIEYEAFCDVLDLCDEDGFIITDDLRKIPVEMRRCINGIECTEQKWIDQDGNEHVERKMKLKVVDKAIAQAMLLKHRGLIAPSETNVTLNVGVVQQVLSTLVKKDDEPIDLIARRLEQEKK
jgi:phage terminase small subunit